MSNKKGMVAAGHEKTVEAARLILEEGGNAFDAAIAGAFASSVVEFSLTSLGGGGFLLAHTNINKNILFDFFTQTPINRKIKNKPDFFPIEVDFGGATQEFHIGLGAMAVPGNLAGFLHVHKKLGKIPLSVVVAPAVELARKGVRINGFQHWCLSLLAPIMTREDEGRKIFTKNNRLINPGDIYKIPNLADSIEYFAINGARAFYEGEIAKKITEDSLERGGYLTMDDFKKYKVVERKPLNINYRGNEFITNPPPSSGGALIAFALELLGKVDISKYGFGSFEHLKILSEIMAITNIARGDDYDKNIYNRDIVDKFLSQKNIEKYRGMLASKVNKWGSTTHLSVIDNEGNAVSMTTSNGEGSSYFAPGSGIMINNMLGEEDLNPRGFHEWEENIRMSSMMSPTMVLRDGFPEIILGSGGSNRIRTAILQVISNIIDFKMSVKEAVNSPRIHWEKNNFNLEPGFSADVIQKIKQENLRNGSKDEFKEFKEKNMFFGGVHTIVCADKKDFIGEGDERRSGVVG